MQQGDGKWYIFVASSFKRALSSQLRVCQNDFFVIPLSGYQGLSLDCQVSQCFLSAQMIQLPTVDRNRPLVPYLNAAWQISLQFTPVPFLLACLVLHVKDIPMKV